MARTPTASSQPRALTMLGGTLAAMRGGSTNASAARLHVTSATTVRRVHQPLLQLALFVAH